jgi:hypothetical protein
MYRERERERERERAREEDYSRKRKHYSNVACFKNYKFALVVNKMF